jgi:hypothetical protein
MSRHLVVKCGMRYNDRVSRTLRHLFFMRNLLTLIRSPVKEEFGCVPYELEYDERWKQATVRIDDQLKLQKLISAFRMSYEYILGK